MSLKRRETSFRGDGGIRLAADAFGSEEHAPVVLLHGGGQTRHSWAGAAERIAREGWQAFSVDLRGHGQSDWCPNADYRFESFAADVAALTDAFERPPVLVGASLGGIASLLTAAREDARPPAALVLVDIATRMAPAGAERIIEFMTSRPDGFASLEEAADAIAAYNPHRKRPRNLSGLEKNLRRRSDGRYDWHWDPRFIERAPHARDSEEGPPDPEILDKAAAALRIPTLLVRGRMSDLLTQEGADEFLRQVPHAKFADVSGAGHMVAGDRNDAFTQSVVDFLKAEVAR